MEKIEVYATRPLTLRPNQNEVLYCGENEVLKKKFRVNNSSFWNHKITEKLLVLCSVHDDLVAQSKADKPKTATKAKEVKA